MCRSAGQKQTKYTGTPEKYEDSMGNQLIEVYITSCKRKGVEIGGYKEGTCHSQQGRGDV